MESAQRNKCLDMLKGIGCIFVIFIHIPFPEETEIGKLIYLLTHFSVPVFFMVSGYYVYGSDVKIILRRVKKLIKMLFYAIALYFIYFLIVENGNYESLFSVKGLLRIFIFGDFTVIWAGHLWFLSALIYIYLIYCVIKNSGNLVYALIPILFTIHIVVYLVLGKDVFLYNNFLLMGLPFFLSGNFIAKYEKEIKRRWNNISIFLAIAAGIIILGLRRFMMIDVSFIGTILYSVGLFVFAIKNPDFSIHNVLWVLGQKYSMYVYIFHVLFISIMGGYIENKWIAPLAITIISVLFSIAFEKIICAFSGWIKFCKDPN